MSETIWSSGHGSPIQANPNSASQYRSVLDSVDPEVAKLLASGSVSNQQLASERRFSFNDGSDIDSGIFGLKRGSFSAITAPAAGGAYNTGANSVGGGPTGQRLNFGTASISGGIASRHPPQDSFLQKFSAVADATREIELSNGLSKISLDNSGNSRRTSFNNHNDAASVTAGGATSGVGFISPHGSLNENLNMPAPRTSRHQSISEKIDQYNNTSPIQASAALSISSDLNSNHDSSVIQSHQPQQQHHSHTIPHNFWNPATATSFTPSGGASGYNYFMDANVMNGVPVPPQNFNPYARNGHSIPPITPPPFMIPSPPPQFMDPGMYGMMYPVNEGANENSSMEGENTSGSSSIKNSANASKEGSNAAEKSEDRANRNVHTPGIGLMNRQIPPAQFMFHGFNPYTMYQQSPPPMGIPPLSPNQHPVEGAMFVEAIPPPTGPPAPKGQNSENANGNSSHNSHNDAATPPVSSGKRKNGSKNGGGSNGANGKGGNGGGNHIYRSPLLEEVRSNTKGKEYFLKDIYGHAVEFTKDQHGSRFIQQKLPDASDEEKEVIFNEIRDISYDLMTDVFGNYVIQKFFEHGSTTQKKILLEYMIGHIYELSLQMYGCRVVQRALEAIDLEGQIKIIEELRSYILICAKDQNGNHVIQKSIERIPFDRIRFILDSLDNQIYHLSTHPYGCRVIQRLLEFSNIEDQEVILAELNRFIFYLIQDQYGNYVMQHILERGELKDREEILKVVLGSVVNFSKHKFASNVIEKCIKYGTLGQRKRILHEVMLGNEDLKIELVNDDSPLALMMKDQYANYVIQKLVEGFDANSEEKRVLVVKLRQYLKQISSKNTYGKHLASVEKMIIVAETALIEADNN
ncbi:translational repressor Pumilio/PUF3 and related RNA-binding protein [Scheffersomyces xylosifermentans]|uniref:translational repressor Pumilio/PUF3 and related RNA-binding protein n=1 Tax=Scheffersomyces xylosifermentans TaxID=1304137 RepID=UPI00315D2F83